MERCKKTACIVAALFLLSLCGCTAPEQSETAPTPSASMPVSSAPEAEPEPSQSEPGPGLDLEGFVAGVSARRQSNLSWTEEELQLAASYADACTDVDSPLLEEIGLERLVTQGQEEFSYFTQISREDILEDIQVLF